MVLLAEPVIERKKNSLLVEIKEQERHEKTSVQINLTQTFSENSISNYHRHKGTRQKCTREGKAISGARTMEPHVGSIASQEGVKGQY